MGRILCEKHGRSPIELVCAHIATPTMTLPTHCIVTLDLAGAKTDVRCCETCATRLRSQRTEEDLELELSDAVPMCAICLAEQY